jgi:transcriptional regulator with XRE-family HTH domain
VAALLLQREDSSGDALAVGPGERFPSHFGLLRRIRRPRQAAGLTGQSLSRYFVTGVMMRIVETKGSAMLAKLLAPPKHTAASVGRESGRTGQAVRSYAAGIYRPPLEVREQLEELLGIPRAFWDEPADDVPASTVTAVARMNHNGAAS